MQERKNASNTSRHQEVVMLLLNLLSVVIFHVLKALNTRSEKL